MTGTSPQAGAALLGCPDGAEPEPTAVPNAVPCSHTGGLAAVIYTDALQTLIMVLGAIVLAVKGKSWDSTDPLSMGTFSAHLSSLGNK